MQVKYSCSGLKISVLIVVQVIFIYVFSLDFVFMILVAYDPLDPTGNVTIKWDVMSWTADGYVVSVFILNWRACFFFNLV